MIQDIAPKVFHNEFENKQPDDRASILVFKDRKCLIWRGKYDDISFPTKKDCGDGLFYTYLFRIDDEESRRIGKCVYRRVEDSVDLPV